MSVTRRALAPWALGTLSLAASPARGATGDERLSAALDEAMRPLMAAHGIPGVAAAVVAEGRRAVIAHGLADPAARVPVTPQTLFELGSVSKIFTATLACRAEAMGRLSLADAPSRHWPALQGAPIDRATLLHLGTYTAGGLPLQLPAQVGTEAALLAYLKGFTPEAAPGTQRRYSNPSIGLFGHLAARALGGDFVQQMEGSVLRPFGMAGSFIRVPEAVIPRYAWGHDRNGRRVRMRPAVLSTEAYGLKASAEDMAAFLGASVDPAGLDPLLRQAVQATQRGRFRVGVMTQGLGWELYPYPVALDRLLTGNGDPIIYGPNAATALDPATPAAGPLLLNKTGSTSGFAAYVAIVPARRLGIALMANKAVPIPDRIRVALGLLQRLAAG